MALTDTPRTGTVPDVDAVRDDARAALAAVTRSAGSLDAAALAAPSLLPGWSRSHVLAHVTAIGEAMARQAERAAAGELVEVYDGGAEGREAGIQSGARRTVVEHAAALTALAERLEAAWPAPGSAGWEAPVSYRDGTVVDALVAWWREVRLHAVDLDTGIGIGTWPPALAAHLLDFLAVRLPQGVAVDLDTSSAQTRAGTTVTGSLLDVAAWLAGRTPDDEPQAWRGDERTALPEIGPWPSPYSPPAT
ncbi:maleylpyruvate isomerase family mycothiol-dependent enzyme [Cellulosimicrobium sp. PMB13]|uniref:maleylpyruvate isomerase family mycothiol-dependent enzyme n=1 Tax=Cellulosimicrobium sp. PMB13 TaxID=3120158 RepID=UPI003F4C700A